MTIWAFIPAGGVGSRMGADRPKQYLDIGGRPLLLRTIERLRSHSKVDQLMVGVSAQDSWFAQLGLEGIHCSNAGAERAITVQNGLDQILQTGQADDWVMVHDAVRPFVTHEELDRLIKAAVSSEHGAILGQRVTDTLKECDEHQHIQQTLDRSKLWRAATPQMFRIELLRDAMRKAHEAGMVVTDEASAMEFSGYQPLMVECGSDNLKITTPSDLEYANWKYLQENKK